jgi:Fur family ferric uptake transcriptional regulator
MVGLLLKTIFNKIMYTKSNTERHREWERRIRETGCRLTQPRRAILQVVAAASHPLTPLEIYDRARGIEPSLGLVTVYRTVEKLELLGLVDRVHDSGRCQAIFRGTDSHQHLLTCTNCGASVYFDGLDAEDQFQEIGKAEGFIVDGHWLQLYGLCKACQQGESENNEK